MALVAAVAAVLLGNRGFRRLVRNAIELRRYGRELSALKNDETRLKSELERMKTSDHSLERAARRELGYMKPGELEYRFPPPTSTPGSAGSGGSAGFAAREGKDLDSK